MKTLLALLLIAASIAAAILISRRLSRLIMGTACNQSAEEGSAPPVSVSDVSGHLLECADGTLVSFLLVEGSAGALAHDGEVEGEIERVANALAGMRRAYRIHVMLVALDATAPLLRLEESLSELDLQITAAVRSAGAAPGFIERKRIDALVARKRLIEDVYLPECRSAAKKENERYAPMTVISIPFEATPDARRVALVESESLVRRLEAASLRARLLGPDEIKDFMARMCGREPQHRVSSAKPAQTTAEVTYA